MNKANRKGHEVCLVQMNELNEVHDGVKDDGLKIDVKLFLNEFNMSSNAQL